MTNKPTNQTPEPQASPAAGPTPTRQTTDCLKDFGAYNIGGVLAQPPALNPGGEPTPAGESFGRKTPKMADDPIYGPIRSEICAAYIAAGQPRSRENWLYSRLVEAKEEIRDYESLLELQRSRTIKADKLWQDAHNAPLTLPDLGGLVEWLIQRAESAEAAAAQARKDAFTECRQIALDEKVDEEGTGEDSDAAYNRACEDIAEAIREAVGR